MNIGYLDRGNCSMLKKETRSCKTSVNTGIMTYKINNKLGTEIISLLYEELMLSLIRNTERLMCSQSGR